MRLKSKGFNNCSIHFLQAVQKETKPMENFMYLIFVQIPPWRFYNSDF